MIKNHKRKKNERQYVPVNPEKYVGNYPIITRSTWEYKFCEWLDFNKTVKEWSSESHAIGYIDPMDGRHRRYYPDFYAKICNAKYIIEIKPSIHTRIVKNRKNKSRKTLLEREKIYIINQAKFKAAEIYAKKIGMKFIVITEKQLFRGK